MNHDDRLYLVRRLIQLQLPSLYRYPGMQADLQAYVATGRAVAIQDHRLRSLFLHLQSRPVNTLDDDSLRALMQDHLAARDRPPHPAADAAPAPPVRRAPRPAAGYPMVFRLGLLMVGLAGIGGVLLLTRQPGFWSTSTGEAAATAMLIGSLALALLVVTLRQVQSTLETAALVLVTAGVIAAVFASIQAGVIDLDLLQAQAAANPQAAAAFGALGAGLLVIVGLLTLRRIAGLLLVLVLLLLIALLVLAAVRFDLIDLSALPVRLSGVSMLVAAAP